MALNKIKDFYPHYQDDFEGQDVLRFDLYSGDEKVGSVDNLLVDDDGKFRYLVINTGAWIFGKKVLLPIGRASIDYNERRVYVNGMTRQQVEDLPEFDEEAVVDYDYEERVRGVYRPMAINPITPNLDANTASLESSPGLYDREIGSDRQLVNTDVAAYDRNNYTYDRDSSLYDLDETKHQNLKLYEERLIASKSRQKTGEVAVGKRVETETQSVSVPLEKERVIIERVNSTNTEAVVNPGAGAFSEGEVVRMDVYEETPDIRKETFVREEVRVTKEVEQTTVNAEETIRKERLDINKDGDINVRDSDDLRNKRV